MQQSIMCCLFCVNCYCCFLCFLFKSTSSFSPIFLLFFIYYKANLSLFFSLSISCSPWLYRGRTAPPVRPLSVQRSCCDCWYDKTQGSPFGELHYGFDVAISFFAGTCFWLPSHDPSLPCNSAPPKVVMLFICVFNLQY